MNKLGVSGSTIMSEREKFNDLFKYNLGHIEIGEFKNNADFKLFLTMLSNSLVTFGIHSPIKRGKSKYDIIEHVNYPPEKAIDQIDKEAKKAKNLGAKYLLVHFPFFLGTCDNDTTYLIEQGLEKLSTIQEKHKIDIVCEPKLGDNRSPWGIEYLHQFPIDIWTKYNLKVCIDIGDYVMAVGDNKVMEYIQKWNDFIKVVHLHNVDYLDDDYFWKPVHPDDESDNHHKIEHIISYLSKLDNIYFVLEHTPHGGHSMEYIQTGCDYIRKAIFK